MSNLIRRFAQDEQGQGLAEYAVLLGLITAALIAVFPPLRTAIQAQFTRVTTALGTVGTAP